MKTKEEIVSSYMDLKALSKTTKKILNASMDEYAKEVAVIFAVWISQKCTQSTTLDDAWFMYEDDKMYDSEELFTKFLTEQKERI